MDAAHVDDVVEGRHEQEAIAAAEQGHARSPDAFHHRHIQPPQPSRHDECHSREEQAQGRADRCPATVQADDLSRHRAEHHRHAEVEAGQQPGVGGVATVAPHHGGIDAAGQVAFGRIVAAQHRRYAVGRQEHRHACQLSAQRQPEQQQCGDERAGGNGLQRVGVILEIGRAEPQQVALHHHAQHEQHHEAAHHLAVGVGHGQLAAKVTGKGEGHGYAAHEQEQGHHQVPEAETLPHLVVEMVKHGPRQLMVAAGEYGPQHGLEEDEQEEVETPQNVERGQAFVLHKGKMDGETRAAARKPETIG